MCAGVEKNSKVNCDKCARFVYLKCLEICSIIFSIQRAHSVFIFLLGVCVCVFLCVDFFLRFVCTYSLLLGCTLNVIRKSTALLGCQC